MRVVNADAVRLKFQQIFDIYREMIDAVKCRPNAAEGAIKLCMQYLDEQPTIEAEPVRHGRWVFDSKYRLMCNLCGSYATRDEIGITLATDYCHSCGAKMDGGADNGT